MYNECLYAMQIIYVICPSSAIDQLRKQFAYFEENDGKSGPVPAPERKHVSVPR